MSKQKSCSISLSFRIISAIGVSMLLCLPAPLVWGAEYPDKPITVVVPYGPGGTDIEGRTLAVPMAKILGQNVLIDNRAGGGGSIGTNYVARSKPDGYILLFAAGTVLSLTPYISDLPYKIDDLIPIASTSYLPQVLSVDSNSPWKTIQEFVEYAKKNPGVINYGSAGSGTAVHLAGEAVALAAEIKLTHVPFKGAGESLTAMLGGHIKSVISMPQTILPQVKAGKVRALALFSSQRFPDLPDVPTLSEARIPIDPYAGVNWLGFFAPKGTPQPICDKISLTVQKILGDTEVLSNFKKIGSLPEFQGSKEFKALIERQSRTFKDLTEKIGLAKK